MLCLGFSKKILLALRERAKDIKGVRESQREKKKIPQLTNEFGVGLVALQIIRDSELLKELAEPFHYPYEKHFHPIRSILQ